MTTADQNSIGDTRLALVSPSGLAIEATTTDRDGLLAEFYRDYDDAFVLANEKESHQGFVDCLALNEGEAYARLAATYGPYREFVLVARDPASGDRVGGANFIAFPLGAREAAASPVLSLNLNYAFITPAARRKGYFARLIRDLPQLALRLLAATNPRDVPDAWRPTATHPAGQAPRTLMFIEQNDPYRMSPEDYRQDTEYTGLDQLERIGIWARLGAKIVDFAYVQPPLTRHQDADPNLVYGVLGAGADTLDACLLRHHLQLFFGVSVLKGGDLSAEPTAANQLLALARQCAGGTPVRLLDPAGLADAPDPLSRDGGARPGSLRDLLRGRG